MSQLRRDPPPTLFLSDSDGETDESELGSRPTAPRMADPPASSTSDSDWETEESESEPRPSTNRISNRRGNASTRRRRLYIPES